MSNPALMRPRERPDSPYDGQTPLQTLLGLYRHDDARLALALLVYIIKNSPSWAMPLVTANIINIITRPEAHPITELWWNGAVLLALQLQNIPTNALHVRLTSRVIRRMEVQLRARLEQSQWDCLRLAARGKHRPLLRLSVDLTSVEKKGSVLPFVRVYNEVHGIHLVVLFAHYRNVKFPAAYRVYRGKSTPTPTTLAREMLRTIPESIRQRFRIRVLADSGFEAAVFLDEVRQLGFEFVVGVRTTRRTLRPGEITVSDCPHGGDVELKNWPYETLTLGRFDRGDRTFHAVSSELMEGDGVIAEGKERWNEESFFKEGKHQFGLAQFATRTAVGLDRWMLLVFLAWTLAILAYAG